MDGRVIPFDRTGPDPSRRDRDEYHRLLFSQRCGLNAIETGLRVLAGAKLHPRALYDVRCDRIVWASQETCREVAAPW